MPRILIVVLLFALALPALAQAPRFEVGTVVAVKAHQPRPADPDVHLYDVSVQVRDTLYVVLYDPHPDSTLATFREGVDVMVAVGSDTMTFNDVLGRKRAFPILKITPLPKKNQGTGN
jgi:hypothetical protein